MQPLIFCSFTDLITICYVPYEIKKFKGLRPDTIVYVPLRLVTDPIRFDYRSVTTGGERGKFRTDSPNSAVLTDPTVHISSDYVPLRSIPILSVP
jgi:hypothetical protein